MDWAKNLMGDYVARAYDCCGGAPVEASGLQKLFAAVAEEETRKQVKADQARFAADRAKRVAALAAQAAHLEGRDTGHQNGRGKARIVVCLTRLAAGSTRAMPRLAEYPSVTAAGLSVDVAADCISNAIRRGGPCRGHLFNYLERMTNDELSAAARALVNGTIAPGRARARRRPAPRLRAA